MKRIISLILLLALLAACSGAGDAPGVTNEEALDPQIVGGVEAIPGAYPWMASINGICGGSLIDQSWVLTAAHCVDGGTTAGDLEVTLGDHDRGRNEGTEQILAVNRIIIADGYDDPRNNNDIALLELAAPARLNARVGIVELGNLPPIGEDLRVIGWGSTSSSGPSSPTLLQVDVPLTSDAACEDAYPDWDITDSMFCAGVPQGGIDSCQGDSGGPIFDEQRRQVGIVSWGEGCAAPGKFGVYTDVSEFNDWINANVPMPDRNLTIENPGGAWIFLQYPQDDEGVDWPGDGRGEPTLSVPVDQEITIVASLSNLGSWTDACDSIRTVNNSSQCTVTMTEHRTITFNAVSHTLTVNNDADAFIWWNRWAEEGGFLSSYEGGNRRDAVGEGPHGTTVTITASDGDGTWEGCDNLPSASDCEVTLSRSRNITFVPDPSTVTFNTYPSNLTNGFLTIEDRAGVRRNVSLDRSVVLESGTYKIVGGFGFSNNRRYKLSSTGRTFTVLNKDITLDVYMVPVR